MSGLIRGGKFRAAGTGAQTRGQQDKLREIEVSFTDYFNPALGETWVTGMRRALTYLGGRPSGGTVVIPEGVWTFAIADLIQDPTTNTSNYRYLFSMPSNVKVRGKSWKSVIQVPANCINSDSANQYWKGYQIFWRGDGTAISGVEFASFKVDCNAANNQVAALNSYGNQAAGSVFLFNNGYGFDISKVWIDGATGHQPVAFYRGTTGISIDRCRFTNCGQTGANGNANLTDQSSIYIEGDDYTVTNNRFSGPSYDYVSTAIEAHGNDGEVTSNKVTNYNCGQIRAAMVSDSQNVMVTGNAYYNVSTALGPDATAGRKLDVVFEGNRITMRAKANAGTRSVVALNTAAGFASVSNQTGNYTRIWFRDNVCLGAGANTTFYLGGFVNELYVEDNDIDNFSNMATTGLHAHNGVIAIRKNTLTNMSGKFLTWAIYDATRDAIDGGGTFPTTAMVDLTENELEASCAMTYMLDVSPRENERIANVDISGVRSLAPTKPYNGIFSLVNTTFDARNYQASGFVDRTIAPLPVLTAEIRDVANDCTFFKQRSDTQLYAKRRGTTAPTSGTAAAAFLGTDYRGDIFELSQPTAAQPVTYYCTTQSGSAGVSGTWKAAAALAA